MEQAKLIFHMHPHGLTEYTVPDGTRAIMPGAFPGPDGYVSVSPLSVLHLPDSLTDVPSLFLDSSRLTEVNLPASLEFLGEMPFGIQNAVDEVLFPDTPPYIAVIRGDGRTIAREIRVNFESPSYRLLLEMGCTNLVDSREE